MGINSTQLNLPRGIILDSSDVLYIAHTGNNRIQKLFNGRSFANTIAGQINGALGSSSSHLYSPTDVALQSIENVFIADTNNHRIQFYLSGQLNGTTIVGITGILGNNSILLYYPCSISINNQLNLYISDTFNHRIQKLYSSIYF